MEDKKKLTNKIATILLVILLCIIFISILFGSSSKESKVLENADYVWNCSKDVAIEGNHEMQIIGIGTKDNADYQLEPGTYEISYDFLESDDKENASKWNRLYLITILDHYTVNEDEIVGLYMISPHELSTKELTFKEGDYVYIEHTPNEHARYGDLYLKKK